MYPDLSIYRPCTALDQNMMGVWIIGQCGEFRGAVDDVVVLECARDISLVCLVVPVFPLRIVDETMSGILNHVDEPGRPIISNFNMAARRFYRRRYGFVDVYDRFDLSVMVNVRFGFISQSKV